MTATCLKRTGETATFSICFSAAGSIFSGAMKRTMLSAYWIMRLSLSTGIAAWMGENAAGSEQATAQPGPEPPGILIRTEHPNVAGLDLGLRLTVARPDLRQRAHLRFHDQGQVVAGVVAAQVGPAALDDQPPLPLLRARVGEHEVDDGAPGRKLVEPHEAADVPHQESRVELPRPEPAPDPAGAPVAELLNDGTQLFARLRELVLPVAGVAPYATCDSHFDQLPKALREQRGRHAGHAAPDVIEAPASAQQLSDNQGSPALAEHLGSPRHRAELAVVGHPHSLPRTPLALQILD